VYSATWRPRNATTTLLLVFARSAYCNTRAEARCQRSATWRPRNTGYSAGFCRTVIGGAAALDSRPPQGGHPPPGRIQQARVRTPGGRPSLRPAHAPSVSRLPRRAERALCSSRPDHTRSTRNDGFGLTRRSLRFSIHYPQSTISPSPTHKKTGPPAWEPRAAIRAGCLRRKPRLRASGH
jgi:hypothetical protein